MDFLTFKSFISIEALIVFYYIGAVLLPFVLWLFLRWIIGKYELLSSACGKTKELLWSVLSTKDKMKLVLFFLIGFLFMQLFWRMFFEFLIAYIQIRDALYPHPTWHVEMLQIR
jgi:hypothetical protein